MVLKTLRTLAVKIWAKIKNSQQWENPNVLYRNILRALFKTLFYLNNKFALSQEMLVCKKYAPPEKIAPFC